MRTLKRTQKYTYVNTPNEKKAIEKYWKKITIKYRKATELYFSNPDITVKDIQKEFNVYISNVYSHFKRLINRGLIYEV